MIKKIAAGAIVAVLAAGAAHAAPAVYSWTGMGTNVSGSSKCATYKMTVDVTVDGAALKGQFQQQGRDQRGRVVGGEACHDHLSSASIVRRSRSAHRYMR